MATMLTTAEAARALKIGKRRLRELIQAGRLRARKHGRDWMIDPKDLEAVRVRRPGRPKQRERDTR